MIKDFFRVLLFPLSDVITLRINRKWALSSKVLISTYVFLGNDECANVSVSCKFFLYFSELDECASPDLNPCNQTCKNSFGSFSCECHQGYISRDEGRICEGIIYFFESRFLLVSLVKIELRF